MKRFQSVWYAAVLVTVCLGFGGPSFGAPPEAQEASEAGKHKHPPNVVIFLADDLGYSDINHFDPLKRGYYKTPNIDALARSGVAMTSAYTNGPNCAPTRASLMSGQYYPRQPIYTVSTGARGKEENRKLVPVDNATVLPLEKITIGERLRDAGYVTAHMGKWHLGDPKPGVGGPHQQGFTVNVGGNKSGSPRGGYFSPYKNKQLEDGPKGEYLTDRLATEACKFIETNKANPFFLYLSFYSVHTPIQGKPDYIKQYKDKPATKGHQNASYAAMVQSLDEAVGKVLDQLDKLNLRQNTLVVFYSDNGGLGGYKRAGVIGGQDITDNAPLRGGKGMLYEGGIRVPSIISLPGSIRKNATNDTPIITIDLYPTIIEAAGLKPTADYTLDGVSLWPILRGDGKDTLERDAIYWHFPGYLQATRNGAHWRTTPAGAVRMGDYKLIEFFETDHVELYNLRDDISETKDLAKSDPQRAATLHKNLKAWRKRMNAPMPTPK